MIILSDFQKHLTREDARNYLQYIENISLESSFDSLITNVKNVVVIRLNENEWENSICSCHLWHKNLICSHIIALACRLKLTSYLDVAYSAPLSAKRRCGRPKQTTSCLNTQPSDLQDEELVDICLNEEPVIITKKRGRKKKNLDEEVVVERRSKRLKI